MFQGIYIYRERETYILGMLLFYADIYEKKKKSKFVPFLYFDSSRIFSIVYTDW